MKATCVISAKDLKTLLKGLNALISEARLHFTDKGLRVRAVDAANVAMVIASIKPEVFEAYQTTEDDVVVGVDLDRLYSVCKSLNNKDNADIAITNEKLTVTSGSMTYTIAVIDPSAIRREPKIPELELLAEVVINAKEFKKAIAAAEKVADEAIFEKTSEEFRIIAERDVGSVVYSADSYKLIEANSGEARAKFSVKYLKMFCKVAEGTVRIRLGTDYPCWLTFEIKDGFAIEYILAPRIETQ